ncbi:cellulose biosynthesis protein BcsD [Yersinia bercovieri]|uniref:cellulose biosynthesis protein BcsD n=1 Tax=Yersinia bercovieri TaxID=634 RepID=UPI001CFC70CF|nr:cellulose biosynthesis protein BcsD [Yersinia bercovieri]MCB5303624.1 cellulose synthase [Yersinia bercovieri]
MQENNYLSEQQDYYRQRQHQSGWQNVVQVLFLGIQANAENADARAFLHSMGAKLAQQQPLPLSQTVGELEDNINHLWASYHWGFMHIDANEQEIRLTHCAWPDTDNSGEKRQWKIAFATFLAGIYSEWLSQQGGHPEVNAQWLDNEIEGPLVFRYKSGI